MWDLQTIIAQNNPCPDRGTAPMRIYDLGANKFALGFKGKRAAYVVRRVANKKDALGRGLPTYKGVQARKPVIPSDARLVRREDAGRLLLRAFALR
jgi:hypothetical protein